MEVCSIPIMRLNAATYNPRVELKPGDPVYENLKLSIETFGFVQPLIVNRRNHVVVGGHQRLNVLKDLGHRDVDVVFVDLNDENEKALNLTLNKTSGQWDESKLADLLQEFELLADFDVRLTGFDENEIDDLISRMLDEQSPGGNDDFDVEDAMREQGPVVTRPGELFQLGKHRLLCGDATDASQVRLLMNGDKASLFATDPPYLVNYDGTNHPASKNKPNPNKNKDWSKSYGVTWDDAAANPKLYEEFIAVAVREAILPNAAWYCFHASRRQGMVEQAWEKFGAFVHQQIIWAKDRPILTRSWYSWQHEPCFFGWVRPHKPKRVSKEFLSSVWHIPTVPVGQPTEHPTSKPLEVFTIPMKQHTHRDDICYEPFCGSGSQIIAAEMLGRRCFALEISPRYCDVIVRRWIHFVGEDRAPVGLVDRYRKPLAQEVKA